MKSHVAIESLLSRVRDWWRRNTELSGLDTKELERVAGELGMSAGTLEALVARGPDAAAHLYERLDALGLSKTDVDRAAQGVLRDLQRTCACCNEKRRCENDLRERPASAVWKDYCPNAVTLDALARLKDRRAPFEWQPHTRAVTAGRVEHNKRRPRLRLGGRNARTGRSDG